VMHCAMCGTDLLVRRTPFWGPICYNCFEKRYFRYQERMYLMQEYVLKQIMADILRMRDKKTILDYIEKYRDYIAEINDALAILYRNSKVPDDVRNVVYSVIHDDRYRDLLAEEDIEHPEGEDI